MASIGTVPVKTPDSQRAGDPRFWSLMLLLDMIFIMVFGAVLAGKIHQYWGANASAAYPIPSKRHFAQFQAKRIVPPAKPTPAVAVSKSEAVSPAAPRPGSRAAAPVPKAPLKPSLGTSASAGGRPVSPARAIPAVFKIRAPRAREVYLVGAFLKRGRLRLRRGTHGNWETTVYLTPNTYRYFFQVDRKEITDPANKRTDARGYSVLVVPSSGR